MSQCLYLLLFISTGNALRLLSSAEKTCTLTFAPHSGFGNILYGALGAGYIAKVTGCKLLLPPIVQTGGPDHTKLAYGNENWCKQGPDMEKGVVSKASEIVGKASMTFDQVFETTALVSKEPLGVLRKKKFLPVHCKLWNNLAGDEKKFAAYLKEIIDKDPTGEYVIGSGYNTGAPRLFFNEVFSAFSPQMEKAIAEGQANIAAKTGRKDYACIHLRSGDSAMRKDVKDKSLKNWVAAQLKDVDRPLLIASAETKGSIGFVMGKLCSKNATCIFTHDVMPSGDFGFKHEHQKVMVVEIGLCGKAQELYLPHSNHKIVNGQKLSAPSGDKIFKSTFSDTMSDIALWDNPHENVNHNWRRPVRGTNMAYLPEGV